jgi:LuxR family maltose regulon positive regulatory protein
MRGFAVYHLGHGERRAGHILAAERAYSEASRLGLQTDNLLLALVALANLSGVQMTMGRLREAAETSQRILAIANERQRQAWPVAGLAHEGLGRLYYEWNDLEAAARTLLLGIEYGQRGGLIGLEENSRTWLVFTLQSQGDLSGADEELREIAKLRRRDLQAAHIVQLAAMEARLRLRQGRLEEATRWAETCGLNLDDADPLYSRQPEYLTLARLFIARGKFEGVVAMLDRFLQSSEAEGRVGDTIEILIQKAFVQYASGAKQQAFELLEHALRLAEPEGYVRSFVDEGEPMRQLLADFQSVLQQRMDTLVSSSAPLLLAYTGRLLAAFSQPFPNPTQERASLIEPLSEREMDILRLIATGHTNKEIADILVIAVSTVKSHINNLYGKLGTQRRTQAIAIARDLGLLQE